MLVSVAASVLLQNPRLGTACIEVDCFFQTPGIFAGHRFSLSFAKASKFANGRLNSCLPKQFSGCVKKGVQGLEDYRYNQKQSSFIRFVSVRWMRFRGNRFQAGGGGFNEKDSDC